MIITIPKEQLQKNINLEKGWYKATFKKMETRKSTDNPNVMNFFAYFDLDCDGREMDVYVAKSTDLRGFQPLVVALRGKPLEIVNKMVAEDLQFDPESNYGKKLQISVDNDPYLGRLISKIQLGGFLPIDADTAVPFGV